MMRARIMNKKYDLCYKFALVGSLKEANAIYVNKCKSVNYSIFCQSNLDSYIHRHTKSKLQNSFSQNAF